MQKILGLFCGGFSSEFDISLKSAETIKKHFPKEYKVYRIFVQQESWQVETAGGLIPFDMNTAGFQENEKPVKIEYGLVYTHGDPGENGKIQAYLDLLNIPYFNSNSLTSSLSFDKWYCNQFLKNFGFSVAESIKLSKHQSFNEEEIIEKIGLPMFVKPTDSGSSFGISKVKAKNELSTAIQTAFKEGDHLVIESFLSGREITCGVYKNMLGIQTLPLTEIVSDNEFFDYEAKYQGKSKEITPAPISEIETALIQKTASEIYQILGLRSIARIDFMLVGDTPYVIEVNTTPGFSAASIVPQMIQSAEKTITQFWREIVDEMEKNRN
jgi:D-alanine-D-alanine ligase